MESLRWLAADNQQVFQVEQDIYPLLLNIFACQTGANQALNYLKVGSRIPSHLHWYLKATGQKCRVGSPT